MTDDVIIHNGGPKSIKIVLIHLTHHSTPQHFVFTKNGVQPPESLLFTFRISKQIEKWYLSVEFLFFKNFQFFTKTADISKIMDTWEIIRIFFQMLSLSTTTTKFCVSNIPNQRYGLQAKTTLQIYTDPKKHKPQTCQWMACDRTRTHPHTPVFRWAIVACAKLYMTS